MESFAGVRERKQVIEKAKKRPTKYADWLIGLITIVIIFLVAMVAFICYLAYALARLPDFEGLRLYKLWII